MIDSEILETPFQVLCQIELHTPGGVYDGLRLPCVGIDSDDLLMVPLPQVGQRPAYLGRFRREFARPIDG